MVLEQTDAANLTRVLLQSLCMTSRCDIQIKTGTGTGTVNHNYITIEYSTVYLYSCDSLPTFLYLFVLLQLFGANAPKVKAKSLCKPSGHIVEWRYGSTWALEGGEL